MGYIILSQIITLGLWSSQVYASNTKCDEFFKKAQSACTDERTPPKGDSKQVQLNLSIPLNEPEVIATQCYRAIMDCKVSCTNPKEVAFRECRTGKLAQMSTRLDVSASQSRGSFLPNDTSAPYRESTLRSPELTAQFSPPRDNIKGRYLGVQLKVPLAGAQ